MMTSDGSDQSTHEDLSTTTNIGHVFGRGIVGTLVTRGIQSHNTLSSSASFRRGRGGCSDDVVSAIKRRRLHLGGGEGSILWSLHHQPDGEDHLILTAIADQGEVGSELLTPQKKLLNSIDIVEKVVMAELNRLKRTPAAKRAEREKKVTTLMSLR